MILLLITSLYFDTGIKGDRLFPYGLNISITPIYGIGIESNVFVYQQNNTNQILSWEIRLKKSFDNETRFSPYVAIGYGQGKSNTDSLTIYHLIIGLNILVARTGKQVLHRGVYLEPEVTIGDYKDYKGFSVGFGIGYRWRR